MTEILDLSLIKNDQNMGFQFPMAQKTFLDKEIRKFSVLVIRSPYQRRQWRPNTIYYFQLDNTFTRKILQSFNKKIKVVGVLALFNTSFNLCFLLVDELNNQIKCRSKYHKILLSKFCLQLNSNLQHFRLKVNTVTGEISFHFQLILENIFFVEIGQIVLFALNCYQQQIAGHLYTLKLLQFVSQFQNQYLTNISQTLQLVKTIIYYKNKEIQGKMLSGQELKELNRNIMTNERTAKDIFNKNIEQESKISILQICDDFFFDEEQTNIIIKDLKAFFIQSLQKDIQIKKELDVRSKFYLEVKKFYQKDKIFSINLIRKAKLSNVLNIQIKKNKLIQDMVSMKKSQNILGTSVQEKKIVSLQQKYKNKTILLQIIKSPPDSALQQYYICEKFTKFQSLRFINQYVKIVNYPLLENGFVALYHAPNKQSLKNFLEVNQESLSLISKSAIAYHLVVIVYTIQQKNIIMDYFPSININNIQISSKYSLSLKRLVTMSQKSIPPLEELLQILYYIFFQKNIAKQTKIFQKKHQKSNSHNFPFCSDQVYNSFLGPHNYINFIKFHIFNFLHLWQIQNKKLHEIKIQSFENKDQSRFKRKLQELNAKFELICENLMIIFGYFREFLGKQSNLQSQKQVQNLHKVQTQN